MKIAVIGTGNVGKSLGGSLVRAGHDVTFAAQDAEKTREVAAELGASAADTPAEAATAADVVVLAVPYVAAEDVTSGLADSTAGKIVIDATNPLKADFSGLATEGGGSGAETFARLLPQAHLAKAFNTIFAAVQADPDTHGTTVDALYATDDEHTAAVVAELAASIGFRPVRVGPLSAARELEIMAWLNMRMQMLMGGDWRTSFVLVGAPGAATEG